MAAIAEGRGAALEAFYDRYAGLAYSLALRILGDRGAAEEVVQDAFVNVWQKAGHYDPGRGRPYTWLARIARNRAIDELRRGKKHSRGVPLRQEILPDAPDTEDSAAEEVQMEVRSLVGGAMSELSDGQREVLELAYMRGLSQREISELTGIPLGTVKTRTRLALKKLREILEPVTRNPLNLDGV